MENAYKIAQIDILAPPQFVTPTEAQGDHPGICHEQLLFFTYEAIYA